MFKELYDQTVLWQMSAAERMAMFYTLDKLPKKGVAVEVGSYKGGFTRILSMYFTKVISIDIDHSNIVDKESYTNVEWLTGSSIDLLPMKLDDNTTFVLIDGDHEYETVYKDVINCIRYARRAVILIHDSSYSSTRKALIELQKLYGASRFFDLDFVPGVPFNGDLIGGLALIYKNGIFTDS